MTIGANEIWANGLTALSAPSVGKLAAGFECGDADPDLFNWLFNRYSQCIFEGQQNLNQHIAGFDNFVLSQQGIQQANTQRFLGLDAKTQAANTVNEGILRTATVLDLIAAPNENTKALTVDAFHAFGELYGAFWRQYSDNNNHWSELVSGNADNAVVLTFPNEQATKGVYQVNCSVIGEQIGVNFNVRFNRRAASPDFYADMVEVSIASGVMAKVFINVNIEAGTMLVRITELDGTTVNPSFQVISVEKLNMPNTLQDGFDGFN